MKQASITKPHHAADDRDGSLLQAAARACEQQELEQAYGIYQSILKRQPRHIGALLGVARVAMQWRMDSLAVEPLKTALSVNINHVAANRMLAQVYVRLSDHAAACRHYEKVIAMQPDDAGAHGELARLYTLCGDLERARKRYRSAFALRPSDPRNLHGLLQTDEHAITPRLIDTVEQQLSQNDLPLADRCSFYFALGAIFDREARYDEAFANYLVGNLARGDHYDADEHEALVDDMIAVFDEALFARHNNIRSVSQETDSNWQPVFIVGMPRSGTTLVEQILAAHSEVHAAGELDRIERISHSLPALTEGTCRYPECVRHVSASTLYRTAAACRQSLQQMLPQTGARLLTDKMPANFLHLGLIALLFPQAKILHCERDPLDVCLSCYFQNFAGKHACASDLSALGHYYKQYQRLMAHWRKILPVPMLTVGYEQLVTDTEGESKRILDFLGLEWQADCLQFHRVQRAVNTASLVQVRQPVYRHAIGRWRHYDKYLQALKKTIGISDIADEVNSLVSAVPCAESTRHTGEKS